MLVLVIMIVAIIALSGCAGPTPKETPTPKPTETIMPTETAPIVTETVPPKEGGVKFIDIAKGELDNAGIVKNTIFVAENTTQIDMFGKWDSDLSNTVKNATSENMLVVAVFLYEQNTGYVITIKDISQMEGKIRITANLTGPSQAGGARLSYPYHVVAVPKDQIRMPTGTIWEAYTEDGTLLVRATYP